MKKGKGRERGRGREKEKGDEESREDLEVGRKGGKLRTKKRRKEEKKKRRKEEKKEGGKRENNGGKFKRKKKKVKGFYTLLEIICCQWKPMEKIHLPFWVNMQAIQKKINQAKWKKGTKNESNKISCVDVILPKKNDIVIRKQSNK